MANHTPLRVQFTAQRLAQVADKFELSALARFLYGIKRLVGGGRSHQRTILHLQFAVIQGKYREFSRFWASPALMRRANPRNDWFH
jgi:hypothetical protein